MIKWHQCLLMWTSAKFRRSLTFFPLGEEVGFFLIYTSENLKNTQKKLVLEIFFIKPTQKIQFYIFVSQPEAMSAESVKYRRLSWF